MEDDETLGFLTTDSLEQEGYKVTYVRNGRRALEVFRSGAFDLCILDIMIPELDGFRLAEAIRQINDEIPLLFLSAKTLKEDRLKGLRLGADDYILKPFSIEELLLKIAVFLKRPRKEQSSLRQCRLGGLLFEADNFRLRLPGGDALSLTEKEAQLLQLFSDHRNKVLKRAFILIQLWGEDDYFKGRSLDVFVARLRKYLADEPLVRIENVHSVGFRMVVRES